MIRRLSPAKLWTLMLASVFIHQGPFAAAAGEKSVPIPSAAVLAAPFSHTALPTVPAAALADVAKGIAPQIDAIAAPIAGAADSAEAARNIQALLQGGKASQDMGVAASLGATGANAAAPSGLSVARPAVSVAQAVPDVSAPPAPKKVDSRISYGLRRYGLWLAVLWTGEVYSLPVAGPRVTAWVLDQAAYKDAVLSDIDDTLGPYNTLLPKETVDAVVGLRRVNKLFATITDRPDKARPGSTQMGALETMSAIAAQDRVGVIAATNGGGKIYEYDDQGEPQLIFEEPPIAEAEKAVIAEAAGVVKAQLAAHGTEMKFENPGPYGYSLILKEGTPEATVKALAHMMEAELKARGLSYNVEPRMAKNASDPPYFTLSKLNKSLAVRRIKELKTLDAARTILIGDSMYAPKHNAALGAVGKWVSRLAERLSGQAMPLTGNAADRNMEFGLSGAMTLSVGLTADPSLSNGYALEEKGPAMTRRVLNAAASQPAGKQSPWKKAGDVVAILLLMGLSLLVLYAFFSAFAAITSAYPAPMDMPTGGLPPDAKHFPF